MLAVILLLGVGLWMGWAYSAEWREEREAQKRNIQKVRMRQQILSRAPHSPGSYEALGDAMRDAFYYQEAVACYEEAIDLAKQQGGPGGGGWVAGAGLETKLKLARFEMQEKIAPSYGQTMRTRQQICRSCGYLNLPEAVHCSTCDAPLPVNTMLDTLRNDSMRRSIAQETAQACAMLAIILLAVYIASWMPLLMRGTLAISAVIVIPIRLLKKII